MQGNVAQPNVFRIYTVPQGNPVARVLVTNQQQAFVAKGLVLPVNATIHSMSPVQGIFD